MGRWTVGDYRRHHLASPDYVWHGLQAEMFKAELRARYRGSGEPLRQQYQEVCRLIGRAYPTADVSVTDYLCRYGGIYCCTP